MMFKYKCKYDGDYWTGCIKNVKEKTDYSVLEIEGMGSSIITYVGGEQGDYWCFFPFYGLSTGLSYPSDIFWNKEKLIDLFDNPYDAVTAAEGINYYYRCRNATTDVTNYVMNLKGRMYSNKISVVLYDSELDMTHLLHLITKRSDLCTILTLAPKSNFGNEVTMLHISELTERLGHCELVDDSPYIGKKWIDVLKDSKL